jgi:MOSC domain-containing protein YiiM
MTHRTAAELEQGMGDVISAPRDEGPVRLIVRRTGKGQREVLAVGELDREVGLVGDDWVNRPSRATGQPSPYAQVTVMNARFAELIAGEGGPQAWAQAGDQLYIDLDLSQENLPPGSRLAVGGAVIEISAQPHTGCAQFSARFGLDALQIANSERGRALRLRGANAVVVDPGMVRSGDLVRKLPTAR